MITHMPDLLGQTGKVRVVSTHHEQGAAFTAEGSGRMTGGQGAAMATSGLGATNLLTGIGSYFFGSALKRRNLFASSAFKKPTL